MAKGQLETYKPLEVFHAQDFPNKLFFVKAGFVKRYQVRRPDQKVLELIYGPGRIVSLSRLYKKVFGVDQNQDSFIYIYQAMTDVEMYAISEEAVLQELEKDPELHKDFFYASGLILKSNISRLASNSIQETDKKVAHQIMSLAYEFADLETGGTRKNLKLPLPHTPLDFAEQLHITEADAQSALDKLIQKGIIKVNNAIITIADTERLKDEYL